MRREAAVLATLCLHLGFWLNNGTLLWLPSSAPVSALFTALATTAFAALFFAGPAIAIHRNGSGLFATVESALGRVPAQFVRFCALWFLVAWVDEWLARASFWSLPGILKRDPTNVESALLALVLLAFLTDTAHESALAIFSIRLSFAVLIACALRVRETPAYFTGHIESLEWNLNRLALAVAPIAFLAASLSTTLRSTRHLLSTAGLGLAIPLWISVFIVGLVNMATLRSTYYRPSSGPNIAMALLGGVAKSARPALLLIVTLTLFGPLRLGLQLLRTTLPPTVAWVGLLAIAAIASRIPFLPGLVHNDLLSAIPATILACTAAVLSAGLVTPPRSTRFHLPSNFALLAGAIVGLHNIREPEILSAYISTAVFILVGRKAVRPSP